MKTQTTTSTEPTFDVVHDDVTSVDLAEAGKVSNLAGRVRVPPWLRAGSPAWIWGGIAVAGAGFILVAIAWGQTAAEVQVYRQIPYLVSAGLVGLGLVLVGLTILNVATRDRDGADRDKQIDQLIEVIEDLRHAIDARDGANR